MTTLANLEVMVARDLRDSANRVWATAELDDLINEGIDTLGDIYPKEVVDKSITISAGVYTYTLPTTFSRVYRLDIFNSSNSYTGTYPQGLGDGGDGWEVHAGVLFLAPIYIPDASSTLRIFGYGRYTQLSASSATTDLPTEALWALRTFCKAQAFDALIMDRGRFQQWQTDQTNTDTTLGGLLAAAQQARQDWRLEMRRLRRMRKLG